MSDTSECAIGVDVDGFGREESVEKSECTTFACIVRQNTSDNERVVIRYIPSPVPNLKTMKTFDEINTGIFEGETRYSRI